MRPGASSQDVDLVSFEGTPVTFEMLYSQTGCNTAHKLRHLQVGPLCSSFFRALCISNKSQRGALLISGHHFAPVTSLSQIKSQINGWLVSPHPPFEAHRPRSYCASLRVQIQTSLGGPCPSFLLRRADNETATPINCQIGSWTFIPKGERLNNGNRCVWG